MRSRFITISAKNIYRVLLMSTKDKEFSKALTMNLVNAANHIIDKDLDKSLSKKTEELKSDPESDADFFISLLSRKRQNLKHKFTPIQKHTKTGFTTSYRKILNLVPVLNNFTESYFNTKLKGYKEYLRVYFLLDDKYSLNTLNSRKDLIFYHQQLKTDAKEYLDLEAYKTFKTTYLKYQSKISKSTYINSLFSEVNIKNEMLLIKAFELCNKSNINHGKFFNVAFKSFEWRDNKPYPTLKELSKEEILSNFKNISTSKYRSVS